MSDVTHVKRAESWSSEPVPHVEATGARENAENASQATLVQDEALYRFLVESLTEYAVFAISREGIIVSWNSGAQQTFGYTEAEIVGRPFNKIFTPEDDRDGAPEHELETAVRDRKTNSDRWHVRKDGSRFWGINTVQSLYVAAGNHIGFTKLVRDMTNDHIAFTKLGDSEQELRLILESVHDYAIFAMTIEGVITSWNTGAEKVFGFTSAEMIGCNYSELFSAADVKSGVPRTKLNEADSSGFTNEQRWLVRKDKTPFLASEKLRQLERGPSGDIRGFVSITHDITERDALAQDLYRRAHYDELTALSNRRSFYEHLHRAIASIKRRPSMLFAVLFIDLDHFKRVNDELGHIVADQLLITTARRLEFCVRSEDVVARIGGDEFAILLNGINGVADAIDAAERIGVEMRWPMAIDGRDASATASIGIAMGSPAYDRPEDVLRDADTAMYSAKNDGRARTMVFDSTMAANVASNFDLAADLDDAIKHNELRVAYQPVVRLSDGTITGFEALVRWQHPQRGLLQPVSFIPKAEESGLIILVDHWVLCEACLQLARWQSEGVCDASRTAVQMSVNISSKHFLRDDFLEDLRDILSASGLEPRHLRIEITESALMEQSERVNTLVASIRALGIEIDIDDFGTGFSSLGALHDMYVDALKIDVTFVRRMAFHHGEELVRTIVTLAHNLGLIAIAEGIETRQQLDRLIALGCDFGQGFHFAPPLTANAAARLLTQGVRA